MLSCGILISLLLFIQLIEAALHGATTGMLDSVQVEEHSLLAYITVLHIASKVYQEQLSQFREVVSYAPAILRQLCELKDKICHSPDASKTFDLVCSTCKHDITVHKKLLNM